VSTEIRVVIADDHPVFRQGLLKVLEPNPDIRIVAEASDGAAALTVIREARPHVAVLDVRMPRLTGLDVAEQVANERLRTAVMLLTMYAEPATFERAMTLGVKGYVVKDAAVMEIVDAISAVAAGRTYISPALSEHLVGRAFPARRRLPVAGPDASNSAVSALSHRERQILRLIAESLTSKEIADALGLNYRTVENQRAAISQKLGLQGSHALVKFAFAHKSEL
jgi:DNA-binding NarL/FixJ family response regulator